MGLAQAGASLTGSVASVVSETGRTRWTIYGERLVDENPHIRLSVASVELPDGTAFEQYVMRMRKCAMTVVLDEAGSRVLLVWRHRFIIDRWVWELPGGYVDAAEDGAVAAVRQVVEETGYRPRSVEYVMTFQPIIGSADSEQKLYLARGADRVGSPDGNETEAIRWFPLEQTPAMIADGQIIGAATIIGVQHALLSVPRSAR